jgi:hypothetical protein
MPGDMHNKKGEEMLTPSEARRYVEEVSYCRLDGEVYEGHCKHCNRNTKQDGIEGHNGWDSYFYTVCRECGLKNE